MPRKKWSRRTDDTPSLANSREKRKWQIALRRYILGQNPSANYAFYFGLDILHLRKWFESQLQNEMGWEDFGRKWQIDHILPVSYFNFENEEELRLCWNFINLKVKLIHDTSDKGRQQDLIQARSYFQRIFETTGSEISAALLEKINRIQSSREQSSDSQIGFLLENKEYLYQIRNYSNPEFQLLNSGKTVEEVRKEMEFLKKF